MSSPARMEYPNGVVQNITAGGEKGTGDYELYSAGVNEYYWPPQGQIPRRASYFLYTGTIIPTT